MKRRELEQQLSQLGWWFKKHGGKHDVWTNGEIIEMIPRHKEIAQGTARSILRNAQRGKRVK